MHSHFPAEVISRAPRLVLTGKEELFLEQHQGIVICTGEEIAFKTDCGLFRIIGNSLGVSSYGPDRAVVRGSIKSICLSEVKG